MKMSYFSGAGYAAGSHYTHTGGLSEYVCLPSTPQWGKYVDRHQSESSIYGAEFNLHSAYPRNTPLSTKNTNGNQLHDNDVPCVYCQVKGRTIVTTFAAHTECPEGWHLEYSGYLMGPFYDHKQNAGPVCMDEAPEVIPGGGENKDGVMFYFVQAACGTLPCPPYVEGREITCVVCSQ